MMNGKDEETVIKGLTSDILKQMKSNCGAERPHYSMFSVGCSMFDIQSAHGCGPGRRLPLSWDGPADTRQRLHSKLIDAYRSPADTAAKRR